MVLAIGNHVIPLSGNEGGSEGSHDAGDIRADRIAAGNFLKASEHRIVVEGAALNHHMGAQVRGLCDLDHLKQSVFDDGVGQSGRNIRHGGALLLGLLYVGIHEHGAAGSQVRGIFGKKSFLCKILHAVI